MKTPKQIMKSLRFWKKKASSTQLDKLLKISEQIHHEQLRQAQAEAAAGTGPQTWDADWFENELDLGEEALALTENWSWKHVQALQEALDWALASPQGQRAQARQEEESAPESTALQMIQELQLGITWRSHTLLCQQAKALGYSEEQLGNLQDSLEELLSAKAEGQEA